MHMKLITTFMFSPVWFTFANIVISLVVMTNANLPSKTDSRLNEAPSKAAYLPFTRIFVGMRMFSSLGKNKIHQLKNRIK